MNRFAYYRRIAASYLGRKPSQLSFWWERPAATSDIDRDRLGPYYMPFADKARYAGPFDAAGVPVLDYHGDIGRQYNPIAIAQYGLAQHTTWHLHKEERALDALRKQADWLRDNLRANSHGIPVWMHDFDWEYAETLRKPWYSGLAQGQGVSCLLRAHQTTGDARYLTAAEQGMRSLYLDIKEGGVLHHEGDDVWIEEYLTTPRSHILNGFIWGLWGVLDHALATGDPRSRELWDRCLTTLERHLASFDTGWWSRYDLVAGRLVCVASPFYHDLHLVQLEVMERLTGRPVFRDTRERWRAYRASSFKRRRALVHKALFKLTRY